MGQFKFSRYNILFTVDGGNYVYNTLSTALAGLDHETFSAFKEKDVGKIKPDMIGVLLEQHFLVPIQDREVDEYLYFYNRTRFGKNSKSFALNFIPSYNCNLACPYCLQGHTKQAKNISQDEIDRILLFADRTLLYSREKDVPITAMYVHLYGGEPMLQKNALFSFADGISRIVKKYSCSVSFSMTSNLTLLDDEMIAFMAKYKIMTQVSIDGEKEDHDARRIFKNGNGTYDIIVNNLKKLRDNGLKDLVVIRLNIDEKNIVNAEKIMAAVHAYSVDVYFGFLASFKGYNDMFVEQCIAAELYPKIVGIQFNEIYKKYGYQIPQPFGKMIPCSLATENKYFVDCFLDVYKCELLLNNPTAKVGVIDENGKLVPNNNFYRQMRHSPEMFPECLKCTLLPLCAGGCAAKPYIASAKNDGLLDSKHCMFTESSLITYLSNYIRSIA
ncbi:MAG: radical SAM protein [Spirochaetaceae bacterium]|jgi:uncharacterized protein|nr:radical SAM protein [Spirochaetaceae bacterium]